MTCKDYVKKAELIFGGLILGLWNNISTVLNAQTLYEKNHNTLAGLCLFFLFLPGIITSFGFIVLHWVGHRNIGKLPPLQVFFYCCILLVFYPILPFLLCVFALFREEKRQFYALLKLLEGFLDDGPQFVLKLVTVVLFKIGLSKERDDVIFLLSMFTSFASLVFFGIKFNEVHSKWFVKLFLACPMFITSVLSRSFILSVFLSETIHTQSEELVGGSIILVLYISLNVGIFKLCRQDPIRSIVFGLSSLIIPAGYNNVADFYQRPYQSLWGADEIPDPGKSMKSGLFLVLHSFANTLLLSSIALYISFSRNLSSEASDSLVLPQMMVVVPGFLFTLARAVILPDLRADCCHPKFWKVLSITLCVLFVVGAIGFLIPASLASLIWKLFDNVDDLID